jgi:hypothetical protein
LAFFLSIAPTWRATRRPSRARPVGAPLRRRRARAPTPRPARRDGIAPAVGAGRPLSSPERRGGGPARAVRRGPSRARNYSPPASAHRMRRAHPSHPSSRSPVASRGYARARRVSGRPGRHAGPRETSAPASSTDSERALQGPIRGVRTPSVTRETTPGGGSGRGSPPRDATRERSRPPCRPPASRAEALGAPPRDALIAITNLGQSTDAGPPVKRVGQSPRLDRASSVDFIANANAKESCEVRCLPIVLGR